jgi:ribokinase
MAEPGPTLVCIGNLTVDESVQPSGGRTIAPGGDAIFAALAARMYLDDVTVLAIRGDDVPDELADAIALAGTTVLSLPARELPTVRNVIHYADDGSRVWDLVTGEQHFDEMSVYPPDVPAAALKADGILISAMSLESQVALGPWLRAHSNATIYLDLQEDYIAGHVDEVLAMVAACDVFMPSEIEAVGLAGTSDLDAAAQFFRQQGPQTIVIKRAENGCLVLAPGAERTRTVSVEVVDAVDSTGAGDAFCGAFAATHLRTGDPFEAARAGSAAAAVAISGHGIDGLVGFARALAETGS